MLAAAVPRPRARALRLHRARPRGQRAARSSRTRSSTPAAAGTWSRATAAATDWRTFRVDRHRRARVARRPLPPARAAGQGRRGLRVAEPAVLPLALRGARDGAVPGRRPAQAPRAGWAATSTPLGEHRCELRTCDDNLDWLALRIAMIRVRVRRPRAARAHRAPAGAGGAAGPRRLRARQRRVVVGLRSLRLRHLHHDRGARLDDLGRDRDVLEVLEPVEDELEVVIEAIECAVDRLVGAAAGCCAACRGRHRR